MNSFLSFDDEFDKVSVTKIPKTDQQHSRTNTSIKSPIRRSEDDDETSADRPFKRPGTVRVDRIYSAKKLRPLSFNSSDGTSLNDSLNVVRVTRPASRRRDTLINSAPVVRPSIVENTIHLDQCESAKKRKGTVRVKRILTAHRKSGIEHRPSQVDTIELSTTMSSVMETTIEEEARPIVRVQKKKKKDRPKSNTSFNVTVERIVRGKSAEAQE